MTWFANKSCYLTAATASQPTTGTPLLFPLSFPFSLLFITNTAPLHDPLPPYSRPVAQRARLTWYFSGGAPTRGQGHRSGATGSVAVGPLLQWGGVALNHSLKLRGHPLSPRWPISDSAGGFRRRAPNSSLPPAQSVASGLRIFWFTLANGTSSAAWRQEEQSLRGIHFRLHFSL